MYFVDGGGGIKCMSDLCAALDSFTVCFSFFQEGNKLFFTCSVLAAGSKLPVLYWTKGSQTNLGSLKMPGILDPLSW